MSISLSLIDKFKQCAKLTQGALQEKVLTLYEPSAFHSPSCAVDNATPSDLVSFIEL